ncbi:UPF0125 protein yfjF [Pasteurellaceae bacterium NI1060]|nr:UPF0125 protein yfjF [Pasteurellaceae bacterium NI1060]
MRVNSQSITREQERLPKLIHFLILSLKLTALFRYNSRNFLYKESIMNQINIEIAYALPEHYYLKSLKVAEGTMVQTAILQSGILQQFTDIDLRENKVGIFSRPTKLTDILKEGDRVEIYRPLLADPKEIRRKRAAEQAAQANKEKGVQK